MSDRHGIAGKWEALVEERDSLRADLAAARETIDQQTGEIADLRADDAVKLARIRQVLEEVRGVPEDAAPRDDQQDALAAIAAAIDGAHQAVEKAELRALERVPGALELDEDEQEAMDNLLAVYQIVARRWKLSANHTELTIAVHTIQGFIVQHMLQRLAPGKWGAWWEKIEQPTRESHAAS